MSSLPAYLKYDGTNWLPKSASTADKRSSGRFQREGYLGNLNYAVQRERISSLKCLSRVQPVEKSKGKNKSLSVICGHCSCSLSSLI